MPSKLSHVTVDHDEIRRWAESRGAKPAQVRGTEKGGRRGGGIIRLDFPGFSGEGKLEEIGWDDWFEKFDDSNLALVYQDRTAGGQKSNFNKLVARESVDLESQDSKAGPPRRAQRAGGSSGSRTTSAGRSSANGKGAAKSRGKSAAKSRTAKSRTAKSRTAKSRTAKSRSATSRSAKSRTGRSTAARSTRATRSTRSKAAGPRRGATSARKGASGGSRRRSASRS